MFIKSFMLITVDRSVDRKLYLAFLSVHVCQSNCRCYRDYRLAPTVGGNSQTSDIVVNNVSFRYGKCQG